MKLALAKTFAEISEGSGEQKDFEIGDPVILFEILRSSMYKDPILTVLREIGTNARDANREVGKGDVPIRIKLPTTNDLQLVIEDDGPGISPDRMDNVFRKFGKSTKRNTNEQHGGFGIGGKSMFAYTDTYTCITVNQGIKYVYFGYIGENKLGTYDLKFSEPTEEPSGTKFFIPVKENDVRVFAKTIVNVVKFWDVKPIITPSVNFETYNYIVQKNNWGIVKKKDYYSTAPQISAIIDGIPYAVDKDSLRIKENSKFSFLFERDYELHIHFNNGDLALAAPRDSLNYNDLTVNKITNVLNEIVDSLQKEVELAISSATSYLDAVLAKLNLSNLISKAQPKSYWQDKEIMSQISWRNLGTSGTISTYCYDKYETKIKSSIISETKNSFNSIYLSEQHYVFIYLDKDVVLKHLASYLLNTNNNKTICIFSPGNNITNEMVEILKSFCILSSNINVPKEIKPRKERIKADENEIVVYKHKSLNDKPELKTVSLEQEVLYYIYDYKKNEINNDDFNILNYFSQFLRSFPETSDIKIYGLTENRASNLPSSWKRLHSFVPQFLESKISQYPKEILEISYLVNLNYKNSLIHKNEYVINYIENNFYKLNNTLLSQWWLLSNNILNKDILNIYKHLLIFNKCLEPEIENYPVFFEEFNKLLLLLKTKYPLIFRYSSLDRVETKHYLDLIHGE